MESALARLSLRTEGAACADPRILQIGAVRVTEDQMVADEFQVLITPKYYRR